MNNPMIIANNISKQFKTTTAVKNLSLSVETGEVFGMLGPNGAGKTTTIRMLTSLIAPTSGEIEVAGYKVGENNYAIRKNVGFLTESPGMYMQLSAERNLSFFATMYEIENIPAQVEKYLRMLNLWNRRQEPVATFSKGMRQKLAIARALLHEPKVLFLDEPTSGLDPQATLVVRDFITDLKNEGRTIILCTHNLDEAERLCDNIGILKTSLLATGAPSDLRKELYGRTIVFHLGQPAQEFQAKIADHSFIHQVTPLENKLVVKLETPEENNPTLVKALVNAGADIQFIGEIKHSLEDIYLQLMENTQSQQTEATND
jgi:ABC-2 type transport system ATP-binding protein